VNPAESPLTIRVDAPILVNGDTGWASVPGITGSGTSSDPYIIENKIIDGGGTTDCIRITDTTKHFIIRNCELYNGDYGIFLDNVTNGQVVNNSIYNMGYSGILIYQGSNHITILNNTCYDNTDHGIFLYGSNVDHISIIHNTCFDNSRGIFLYQGSDYNMLQDNEVYNNTQIGISLQISSNNTISGNVVTNNGDSGIQISINSHDNTVNNNIASNNDAHGIELNGVNGNNISYNIANDNKEAGIYIDSSNNNIITKNVLHRNAACINETGTSTGNTIVDNSCHAPTLTEGTVSPSSGDTSTQFVFSVIYTDADNQAPVRIQVYINGVPYDMSKLTPSDNTYSDGCIYIYQTTMPPGNLHTYYFEAVDIIEVVRAPPTGENLGPTVSGKIPGFTWIISILGLITIISLLFFLMREKYLWNLT